MAKIDADRAEKMTAFMLEAVEQTLDVAGISKGDIAAAMIGYGICLLRDQYSDDRIAAMIDDVRRDILATVPRVGALIIPINSGKPQ